MFSRADKIRKALMREVSDILRREVKDPRITAMVSVTDAEISSDYRYAKIFVSLYGNEEQKKQTMEALGDSVHKVRGEVGKRIRLRYTPEVSFILDDSFEHASKIQSLLDKISKGEV